MADPTTKHYSITQLARPGVAFDVDIADPKQRVQAYLDSYRNENQCEGFDEALMRQHLKLTNATAKPKATVDFEMIVAPTFGSRMGNMHGGAIALVYDMCTTMCAAPLSRKDFWRFGGVTRTLSVTCFRPAKVGMQIVIECEVLQMGAKLATIRGVMKDKTNGTVLSVAEHNKALVTFQADSKI